MVTIAASLRLSVYIKADCNLCPQNSIRQAQGFVKLPGCAYLDVGKRASDSQSLNLSHTEMNLTTVLGDIRLSTCLGTCRSLRLLPRRPSTASELRW